MKLAFLMLTLVVGINFAAYADAYNGSICRGPSLSGMEEKAEKGISHFGLPKTRDLRKSEIAVFSKGKSIYVRTNYISKGEKYPATIFMPKEMLRKSPARLEQLSQLLFFTDPPSKTDKTDAQIVYRHNTRVLLSKDVVTPSHGHALIDTGTAKEVFFLQDSGRLGCKLVRFGSSGQIGYWRKVGEAEVYVKPEIDPQLMLDRLERIHLKAGRYKAECLSTSFEFNELMVDELGLKDKAFFKSNDLRAPLSKFPIQTEADLDKFFKSSGNMESPVVVIGDARNGMYLNLHGQKNTDFSISVQGLRLRAWLCGVDLLAFQADAEARDRIGQMSHFIKSLEAPNLKEFTIRLANVGYPILLESKDVVSHWEHSTQLGIVLSIWNPDGFKLDMCLYGEMGESLIRKDYRPDLSQRNLVSRAMDKWIPFSLNDKRPQWSMSDKDLLESQLIQRRKNLYESEPPLYVKDALRFSQQDPVIRAVLFHKIQYGTLPDGELNMVSEAFQKEEYSLLRKSFEWFVGNYSSDVDKNSGAIRRVIGDESYNQLVEKQKNFSDGIRELRDPQPNVRKVHPELPPRIPDVAPRRLDETIWRHTYPRPRLNPRILRRYRRPR